MIATIQGGVATGSEKWLDPDMYFKGGANTISLSQMQSLGPLPALKSFALQSLITSTNFPTKHGERDNCATFKNKSKFSQWFCFLTWIWSPLTSILWPKVYGVMLTQPCSMPKCKYTMREIRKKRLFPSIRRTAKPRGYPRGTIVRLEVMMKGNSEQEGRLPVKCLVPWKKAPFLLLFLTEGNGYDLFPGPS